MQTTSEAQYRAAMGGGVPEPEAIADGLWSVAVPMPGDLLAYTLSVVHVGPDGAVTIVDPGWETPEVHARIAASLAALDRTVADIRWIVATHAHPDHLGAADALRRASGAQLLLHEREQADIDLLRIGTEVDARSLVTGWGAPEAVQDRLIADLAGVHDRAVLPDPADALLRDGDRLPMPGFECEVLATAGHTAGHICLVDRDRKLVFSGDHVLPTVFPGVGLSVGRGRGASSDEPNPVAAYLESLERLAPYDGFEVVPGHGYRFRGFGGRRREMEDHLLRRAREVGEALAADPEASTWEVASRLTWSAGWDRLSSGPMLSSALLQTALYADFMRGGGVRNGGS